jgi:hypothetical protein
VEETEEDPFFVPHGYLSDGEGAESAGESENDDEDEEVSRGAMWVETCDRLENIIKI